MTDDWRQRTKMLVGQYGADALKRAHVAVFGLGGVGSYTVESLVRSGVGELTIVDADTVKPSNLNRQLIALNSTLEMPKVRAQATRARDINPNVVIHQKQLFVTPENISEFNFPAFCYVVDAIDTVSAKIAVILAAQSAGIPVISAMGCGNKLNPAMLEVADIYKTSVCPLARVMRRELKKRGAKPFKVVYSKEEPVTPLFEPTPEPGGKRLVPGSMAFVPGAAGLIMGAEVVRYITGV